MIQNTLFLKIPTVDELDYRINICADKDTMDYNFGYGDDGSGCYFISKQQAVDWYKSWNNCNGDFYAYVFRYDDNCPVGEVNFHYDSRRQKYFIGVVIEAKYRGKGYSVMALDLLADKAFNQFGITELYNDFPPSRVAAEKAHNKVGFERLSDELVVLTAKRYNELKQLQNNIETLSAEIATVLQDCEPSLMLYGSVVYDDFKFGWSDIDFVCVTEKQMSHLQANMLLNFRQHLSTKYPNNDYFGLFEGIFVSTSHLTTGSQNDIVYWGTTGQRIVQSFTLDPFSRIELLEHGKLVFGKDFRHLLSLPTQQEIQNAIENHYKTVRNYAHTTGESLYSAGWMLDIARCLYTLKTGKVISKTQAGHWAMDNNLCPTPSVMEKVLQIRNNPTHYKSDPKTLNWLGTLNPHIQQFADILEKQLDKIQ